MKTPLRSFAIGALALGTLAGGAVLGLASSQPSWQPMTSGLTETPEQLLPSTVSATHPVRVVSTALDDAGRPVFTAQTATDPQTATSLISAGQHAKRAISVELDAVAQAATAPTGGDPSRGDQWYLNRIQAPQSWAASTGSGVVVAVLDTGVDASHPDLAGQVLPGYDAITRTADDGTDPNGHGTQVAGVIAALTGNEVGISGVAPDAKILPVRVLGAMDVGYASDIAAGIVYAADHSATVINLSLTFNTRMNAVSNAIAYARSRGAVVVAAGGNSRIRGNTAVYPGGDGGVIAVAATDAANQAAVYSTKATYIDVAAPGMTILGTFPGDQYRAMSGTSAAAPQVSAIAALVKAAKPTLTPDQVEAVITGSATDIGAAGPDADFGRGLVNAAAAVTAATTTPSPSPSASRTPTTAPTKTIVKRPVLVRTTAPTKPVIYGTTATVRYTVMASGKPFAGQPAQLGIYQPGSNGYTYTNVTTDEAGIVEYSLPATRRFQIKLVIAATDTNTAASSVTSAVTVRSDATVSSVDPGVLTVDLACEPGLTVQVQRLDSRQKWANDSTFVVDEPQQQITGLTTGAQYRVVVPATTTVTGVNSSAMTIV